MSKDNKYWFKRRRYGWGYIPVTWQGWALIIFFIISTIAATRLLPPESEDPTRSEIIRFSLAMAGLAVVLVFASIAKGPKPRWRWGKKPTDNPEEDF